MSTQNKYLESKYIKVFPSGFRSLGFTESKLTTVNPSFNINSTNTSLYLAFFHSIPTTKVSK